MSGIERWHTQVDGSVVESVAGTMVLFYDHEAEVARLRAEADKYRKDARRWRFVASAPGSVTLRIHNTRADGRDAAIDAAIGGH